MARKPRIQYPGAIYHVMSRGDRREAIFGDDADRHAAKGEWRKVELARELRTKTTMSLAWIAEPLSMGTPGHLA